MITLLVSISEQKLTVLENDTKRCSYPISSSKNGIGTKYGSFKTPTGNFIIDEKYGHDAPIYTIFKGRVPAGVWATTEATAEDLITSRILWLDGQDVDNANSKQRFIYIHGTNHEDKIGAPHSCGCIRMRNRDIIELFDIVREKTPVTIAY